MNFTEFRSLMSNLPPLPDYERFTWGFRCQSLRDTVATQDPREFLQWPVSREALYAGNTPEREREYSHLMTRDRLRYSVAITCNPFGNPDYFESNPSCDPNLIHQCYYLSQFEALSGMKINDLTDIYEFGAGYGAMKLVVDRLGFNGYYFIQDLPELLYLQQYYLSNVGSDLMGTVFANYTGVATNPDLFIACCSLSECPVELRQDVLSKVRAKNYLIVYQHQFGIDNHAFFKDFQEQTKERVRWVNWRSEMNGNHWFLIGKEK